MSILSNSCLNTKELYLNISITKLYEKINQNVINTPSLKFQRLVYRFTSSVAKVKKLGGEA